MYEDLFGFLGLPENPFAVNPQHLFLTPWSQKTLIEISDGIRNRKGLILLTGEAGTGKTTLIHSLLESLDRQGTPTAFIFYSRLKVSDLFDLIFAAFGIPCCFESEDSALQRIHSWLINQYLAGETPVLIVDEAQGLRKSVLQKIPLLLNWEIAGEKLLQIVLAGQPELEQTLERAELIELRQRISCHCKTAPLSLEQTVNYIRERLRIAGLKGGEVFTSEAIEAVYFYSQGILRVVNLLCEHALINACAGGVRPFPAVMVEEVAREFQFGRLESFSPRHISDGILSVGRTSEVPSDLREPIHSPVANEAITEVVPPESTSVALSSWNAPEHEKTLSSENTGEHASEAKEAPDRTSSIGFRAEADAGTGSIASSVEVDRQKAHDVSQLAAREKVTAPSEHVNQVSKASTREQFIRRVQRMSTLPAFRSLVGWVHLWRDRCLAFLNSIAWRRMAAFLLLWLRKPIGAVRWSQTKPLLISYVSFNRWMAILPSFRSLNGWVHLWRDRCLAFLNSIAWRRMAAFLLLWLRKPIGAVRRSQTKPLLISYVSFNRWIAILPAFRSLSGWMHQWRDRCLAFLNSIAWRRMAAFLLLWLRKPTGAVRWSQTKPLLIPYVSFNRWMAILPSFRSLNGWVHQWRDRCLTFLNSIAWQRMAAFLLLWLRKPIGAVRWRNRRMAILPSFRSLEGWVHQWRDRCLAFLNSIACRRMAAFLLLWLREPIGTVHWCQVKPLQFSPAWTRMTRSLLRRLRQPVR